jgi:hypothetical protein
MLLPPEWLHVDKPLAVGSHKLVEYCTNGSVLTVAGLGLLCKQSRPSWRSVRSDNLCKLAGSQTLQIRSLAIFRSYGPGANCKKGGLP